MGENCRLRGSVVCRAVTIKNGSLLEEGTVIGSEVTIGTGATVNANVRIWPNKDVEAGAVVRDSIIWAGSWKRGLFTAYGLTGLANVEFTPEFAARLGAAIGALYPKGASLAVSRDHTRSARMIHRAMIAGMISSGANVMDLSALTIPTVRHWARQHKMPAVHVQTSPVDPRSADIRIFDHHGLDLDKRSERKLENLFFREDIRRVFHYEMGRITRREEEFEGYIGDMLARLDLETVRQSRLKVLVDYNNGASAQVLPRVLQEMSCEVIPLNAAPEEVVSEQDDPACWQALFSAVPSLDGQRPDRIRLQGEIPSAADPPGGCVFHTRCPRRLSTGVCESTEPPLLEEEPGHLIRCHIPIIELRQLQLNEPAPSQGGSA